jgi:hypothetical protein
VIDGQIESVQNRLESWYEQLPSVLRVDEPRQRTASPPPHILSLNLLYRTLLLILFRNYQRDQETSVSLVHAHKLRFLGDQAAMLHDLFILYCRTFQCKAHTYVISYCVYTAATVDIGFIRTGSEEQRHAAALRLRAALKILEAEGRQTPGIKKSVDTIKKQIKTAATEREKVASGSSHLAVSQQPSFDQAFATSIPDQRHDSVSGAGTASIQGLEAYSQGTAGQYFPHYAGLDDQHVIVAPEGTGWQSGGQGHDMTAAYNPAAFGWGYGPTSDQGYAQNPGAHMYGWPPTSRMP